MKFDDLTFVSFNNDGEYRKAMPWCPVRTGDYSVDTRQGREYFAELHTLIMQSGNPTFLSRVLNAQVEGGKWEAVEIGFSQAMAEKLLLASA